VPTRSGAAARATNLSESSNISDGQEIELGRGAMHWEIAACCSTPSDRPDGALVVPGDRRVDAEPQLPRRCISARPWSLPERLRRSFLAAATRRVRPIRKPPRAGSCRVGSLDIRSSEAGTGGGLFRRALSLDDSPEAPASRPRAVEAGRRRRAAACDHVRRRGSPPLRVAVSRRRGGLREITTDASAAYARATAVPRRANTPSGAGALAGSGAIAWVHRRRSVAYSTCRCLRQRATISSGHHTAQGRNADALLEELRQPFLEAGR
jgi:hypothetical protein